MPTTITTTKTSVTERHEVQLDGLAICKLLNDAGIKTDGNLRVYFSVPGGGDWSNTDIDISAKHPVTVVWEITRVTETVK